MFIFTYINIYIYTLGVQRPLNGLSEKTIILVGIYNQQFQGTIILMVFDFQGIHVLYNSRCTLILVVSLN